MATKGDNTPTNTLREEVLEILRYPNNKRPERFTIATQIRHFQADQLVELIAQAVNKAELACAVYMEPGRFQDYKNRRDGTFQNDPRLNRDETPNQVEGK